MLRFSKNIFGGLLLITICLLVLCEYAKIGFLPNWQKVVEVVGRIPETGNQTTLYPQAWTTLYPQRLAWILNFNYEPHPEALKTLLHYYAHHFEVIVIVSPVGRVGPLLDLDMSTFSTEVLWSVGCPTNIHIPAGLMMICYAMGLYILQGHEKFQKVDYVVLSNDDVILNMTKVREFASNGRPVSHRTITKNPPPMFATPPANVSTYFEGWGYASYWPKCQKLFETVPPKFKTRYLDRHGNHAGVGGVDVFFLPSQSVSEFTFLSSFVGECWIELGIPMTLGMLTIPTEFYSPPSKVFMYRWWRTVITPEIFENELANHSIVSFHPFKLSYPEHRSALKRFMAKYKFSE